MKTVAANYQIPLLPLPVVELLVIDSSSHIYRNYQARLDSSQWQGWELVGNNNNQAISITAAVNLNGKSEIFTIGTDYRIYHFQELTAAGVKWGAEQLLDARQVTSLEVAQNQDGRLELFVIGKTDRRIYHIFQTQPNGPWSSMTSIGNVQADELAIGKNRDGRLEVFALTAGGDIVHFWQVVPNGSWAGGGALPRPNRVVYEKSFGVGRYGNGDLVVFSVGSQTPGPGQLGPIQSIYRIVQANTGIWSPHTFVTLSPSEVINGLTVANNSDKRLEFFYLDGNNNIQHAWETSPNSASWQGPALLGNIGNKGRDIAVTNIADGRLLLFHNGMGIGKGYYFQQKSTGGWTAEQTL